MGTQELNDDSSVDPQVLRRLMEQIHQRVREMPENSYTTRLIQGGVPKMGSKITEEAREVVEAAAEDGEAGRKHLVYEACDLIYHLWVLLGSRGITLDDLESELARREGTSGLIEKQNRTTPSKPS
jgi:phosphoribosyl-ATP pyrophosphohydrolase